MSSSKLGASIWKSSKQTHLLSPRARRAHALFEERYLKYAGSPRNSMPLPNRQ